VAHTLSRSTIGLTNNLPKLLRCRTTQCRTQKSKVARAFSLF
jgi:hypothetical protein